MRKRTNWTFETVKEFIKAEGYILLSDIYIKSNDKLFMLCSEGHKIQMAFRSFVQGKRCRECSIERKRLGYEYVKNFIENEGYTLIDKIYKNNLTKLNMICPFGHEVSMLFANFQKGHRCVSCAGVKRHEYEFVKSYFEENHYKLISEEYKNANQKLTTICPNNHRYIVAFNDFKNQGHRCVVCYGKKKFTFEYVRNFIEQEDGYKLISTNYNSAKNKIKIQCPENHIYKTTFSCFKQGHRCNQCAITRKYTYQEVEQFFSLHGYQLLSPEYPHNKIKLLTKCPNDHIYRVRFSNFKLGNRCPKCSGREKYTYEQAKEIFDKNDLTLLSDEYHNNRTPMIYQCSCGEISKITLTAVLGGGKCLNCAGKRNSEKQRFSYEYVKRVFHENNCLLLSETYTNNSTLLDYICECGNLSKIRFNDFKNGYRCYECGVRKRSDIRRTPYEKVFEYFLAHDCLLLSTSYKNDSIPLRYLCECGEENKITFESFKLGSRCRKCGINKAAEKRRYEFNFVQDNFTKHNCKLISTEYSGCNEPLEFVCSCGNPSITTFHRFLRGTRCRSCFINKISKENHYLWKGGENSLSIYLRSKLYEWRIKSLKSYKFKCIITGENKNLEVHHLYGFSNIVDEVLIELDIDLLDHYGKYTKDELELITHKCLDIHEKYGLGVPLTKELHREFHITYGYSNFTINDFEEFKKIKSAI